MSVQLLCGDVLDKLKTLPSGSVRCCVTSPPYWGLRNYGMDGQIGLESTPEAFVGRLVEVFREVRRVLTDDGTLWLNLGDSYAANRSYQVGETTDWPYALRGRMKLLCHFLNAEGVVLSSHTVEHPDESVAYATACAFRKAVQESRGVKVFLQTQEVE